METRTITQVKVHKLILNPMTDRAEAERVAAFSADRSALEKFLLDEKVDMYMDDNWGKVFRKGGPLEWFNYSRFMNPNMIEEEWVEEGLFARLKEHRHFHYVEIFIM